VVRTEARERPEQARNARRELRDRWPLAWQYALAFLLIVVALWGRWLLDPVLGDRVPFISVFGVLLPLVLLVRAGPFLAAAVAGLFGVQFLFVQPRFVVQLGSSAEVGLFLFTIVIAAVTAWMVDRARSNAEAAHVRTEQAMRRSEADHRALFEAAGTGNAEVERATGRFVRVNRRYCALTGYSAEELVGGMTLQQITHHEDAERLGCLAYMRGETPTSESEERYLRKDGAVIWVQVACTLLGGGEEKPDRLLVVAQDVTDRKRAESEKAALLESERCARAEAERASRVKDEFMATLSHELRTPINAVLGWAQLIRRGATKGDELGHAIEIIERNARLQAELISDLLDMSRIVVGKLRLELEPVDLVKVVESAISAVDQVARAKEVRVARALERHPTVLGDAARLEQIVWNLLTNAIKFARPGGNVRVGMERVGARVEVTVQDDGQGIASEFLPRIFDRLSQADSSTTRTAGGLGLGLAISKQLAELHGGTIRAASAGLGHGASFVVSLPVQSWSAGDERPAETDADEPGGALVLAGVQALVVDDEPDARLMVKRVLEEHGASVAVAVSAADGLASLAEIKADIVLSDIGMPEEDGYAFVRRLRGRPAAEGGTVPAVALTAYVRPDDQARALREGYQAHLAKPVGAVELVALVRKLVQERRGAVNDPRGESTNAGDGLLPFHPAP
jgi:PAS domain S-box-containing protein